MPEGAIYVGRGSMWGNPFQHPQTAVAASMFRVWLTGGMRSAAMLECRKVLPGPLAGRRSAILGEVSWLRGRDLACWCRPGAPCHADALLALANG